jgi:tetraacyldisaccharide 4'-kinase
VSPSVPAKVASLLVASWRRRRGLALLLLPVAGLYLALVGLHKLLYRGGLKKACRIGCPVLVVGNAVAGGAGKTPTVIALVQHFRLQGIAVGVVSRGYGRTSTATLEVTPEADPADVGDEPLLIARATQAPVFVAAQRVAAARALRRAHPGIQLIVCDDGLQHYPLYRDLEVCVFDDRGIGNGWVLPSGPLREPWPRSGVSQCGQSDATLLVLHTGAAPAFAGYRAHRQLADYALRSNGQRMPLSALQNERPLLALAGIAQPEVFFSGLRQSGVPLAQTLGLPDHCDFAPLDIAPWAGFQVLCTEKDAVKLWKRIPDALAVPLLQTMDAALLTDLDALLQPLLARQLSSGHGHQTA